MLAGTLDTLMIQIYKNHTKYVRSYDQYFLYNIEQSHSNRILSYNISIQNHSNRMICQSISIQNHINRMYQCTKSQNAQLQYQCMKSVKECSATLSAYNNIVMLYSVSVYKNHRLLCYKQYNMSIQNHSNKML